MIGLQEKKGAGIIPLSPGTSEKAARGWGGGRGGADQLGSMCLQAPEGRPNCKIAHITKEAQRLVS